MMAQKKDKDSRSSSQRSSFLRLCCCCLRKQEKPKHDILLDESSRPTERKHYTVMFGMCPKGLGVRVQSTLEGPKISKLSAQRWNKLDSGDRLLMINDDNIQDSKPENVQFLLLNLDQNEAILTVEKDVARAMVGVRREMDGFGFDFKTSGDNRNAIVVHRVLKDYSNGCRVGDKVISINDIDASMINIDDLQSMLDTPGSHTKLVIERIVPIE